MRVTAAVLVLSIGPLYLLTSRVAAFYTVRASHTTTCRSRTELWSQQQATFGMGCFWKPSEELQNVPGVEQTIVGYTGHPNPTRNPDYETVCFGREWVEAVRVYYNDNQLSYRELLEHFFQLQESKLNSRQYGSYIFATPEQEPIAKDWILNNGDQTRGDNFRVDFTTVESPTRFFQAESYHQDYWQKMRPKLTAGFVLLAVSTGVLDAYTPMDLRSPLHTTADAIVLAGLIWTVLERRINTKTIELS